ncbi:hypothetical protein VP1G_11499 [Cytospora mali]|uniref:Uncharacterized protein n=1 Tax=Cytospora mali TaxID=578113 RepID=A0A194VHA0_CYTMA|nr:hypothetical protein VP1G_11499 [Valsa mali var. pyri (nom. inval.)]
MSLARAFTTRRAKVFGNGGDSEGGRPHRSHTVKGSISGPIRSKISGPVELIHTTNMLSYNAPDIQKEPKTSVSTSSLSTRSDGDSDHNPPAAYSPPTSPDSPFPREDKDVNNAPGTVPNHLSCYFTLPGQNSTAPPPPVPSIPKRAPSHTKKSYESLARKPSISRPSESTSQESLGRRPSVSRLSEQSSRTVSTKSSFSFSRSSSTSTNTSASTHNSVGTHQMPKTFTTAPPPVPPTALSTSVTNQHHKEPASATDSSHPFGHELAQVTELAEEYASTAADKNRAMFVKEERELIDSGLKKFTPEDYISEIQGLFSTFFGEVTHARNPAPQWI